MKTTKKPCWIGCLLMCLLIATSMAVKADPIHEAAVDGDVEQVKQLLIDGADVNAPDPAGTPLQWALFADQTAVVRLLLEYGADANIDGPGGTSLQMAVVNGDTEIVQLLLDHGGNPTSGKDSTPLHLAVQKGNLEVVELFLARGADPNYANSDGNTPLHEAAKEGELEIAQRLVDRGADVNALSAIGWPPIHFAVRQNHATLAAYLKKQGAAPGKVAPITDLLASADLAQGELEAKKLACHGCHVVEKYGPPLWNVVGRPRGSVNDYPYSAAFKALGGEWTFEALNEYLARPAEIVPGTKMSLRGISDPQTRANIILYLRSQSDHPIPLP